MSVPLERERKRKSMGLYIVGPRACVCSQMNGSISDQSHHQADTNTHTSIRAQTQIEHTEFIINKHGTQ